MTGEIIYMGQIIKLRGPPKASGTKLFKWLN